MKRRGTVKWFDELKGYGFLTPEGEEKDVFVHKSNINTLDKTLEKGEVVDFEITQGKKGPEAIKVTKASES